ncbi:EutN/CcmL family microcompartment protein [Lacisediminimonas sp.]|jgi:ethanolamine utilization protein EutN|uniref:EutN/CcmL family microcompartment protein n=1 Tax=Lacisediminimonas sp. TaxID=3060582 RepID=UPI002723D499|nr:EutN/CcmL family microcompartment protein [Lacisediminimonas sp.]MDO8298743.1 EutN/CcmL family microcompartment protein [Lacisediminimonas sp.]MDO9217491.1 EutN/CcmL family microcompartment protein [Lacisediminimonas sp.]
MLICRIVGTVVSTVKQDSLRGSTLLLVQRADASGAQSGEPFIAADTVGAGEGELVMVATGSAARQVAKTREAPVDAAIIGIIDSVAQSGGAIFRKTG